jgi:dipeptidyl aminopeptidase/acylaminoacyl peptidase
LTRRARILLFAVVTVVAVAAGVTYVAWAAFSTDSSEPLRPASSQLRLATATKPYLVYQYVARDDHYAEVAIAPLDRPGAKPTFTGLVCERVYFAAERGLCLIPKQNALGAAVRARVFGRDFQPARAANLDGIASRARVSPSGRYGATTTFVAGHSYQDQGFSTNTSLIDMAGGKVLTDIEDFRVTRDGKPFKAIDFNFWGVTFAPDDRHFYATLQSGGKQYLIEGDLRSRTARVIHEGVECPSLSPDGRRVAFKKRYDNRWRLTVLDLASGQETPLAETRSVDDQVEWLDDGRILYGLQGDIWVVPADGSGTPQVYLADALSPAVVRS